MPLEGIAGSPAPLHADRTASPAAASAPSSARASYVRPTPAPPAPRMVLDDEAPFSFDWARKAAQAVVAHARFMDWVERPKPGGDAIGAESPGLDHRSAVSAYGEFGADEPATSAAASLPSLVVMRGPEPGR